MSNTPAPLLSFIRGAETSRGYEDYSRFSKIAPPKPLTQMTVREVQEWQRQNRRAGSKSTAAGGYQFISGTFNGLVEELDLTGDEVFDSSLQDQMAMRLLERRGFSRWQAGEMSDEDFMDSLAKEWAALPTRTGRGFYDGDGLNAAGRSPAQVLEALNATREGRDVDLSGIAPEDQRWDPSVAGAAQVAAARQQRMSIVDPMQNYTGADMQEVAEEPLPMFRTTRMDAAVEQAAEETATGFWEGASLAVEEGQIISAFMRQMGREDFTPQPGFRFDDELWKEVTEGLPEEYHEGFESAVSPAHARALAQELRRTAEIDQKLGAMGWAGTGLRLGAVILDPVAIVASVVTEGAAAPVIYTAKASKITRFLRGGASAAAVNVAIDGYIESQNPISDWQQVAYSAAAGFILGGALGAFGRTVEDEALDRALKGFMDDIDRTTLVPRQTGLRQDGSLSAARVADDRTIGEKLRDEYADAPMSALAGVRYDMVGVLKTSENGLTRQLAALLAEDAVGNKGDAVNIRGASENVARDMRVRMARFYRDYEPAFKAWAKEQNFGWFARSTDPAVRARFNREVGFAVRRELDAAQNTHVQKVASRIKTEFADLLQFGREMGIRGFDEIKENANYMTRRHRIEAMDDIIERMGEANLRRVIANSLMSADRKARNLSSGRRAAMEPLSQEDAFLIAKAYIKSVRSRKHGQFEMNRALAGVDLETLDDILADADLTPEEATRIREAVRFKVDSGEKGRMESARRRLDLDETYREDVLDLNGNRTTLGIEDFIENDAEVLFTQYARSVIGYGRLEEALSTFKVADAEGNLPAHAPSFRTLKGYIADTSKLTQAEQRREFKRIDALYNAVVGRPQEPPSDAREAMRLLRDFNFTRIGGQLGIAQLAEIGMIVGQGGMRVLLQNIPALRRIFANAKTGKFSDDFLNEIEAIWGFGTDLLRNSPVVRMDDVYGGTFEGRDFRSSALQRTDFLLQQGKIATTVASGMGHINMVLQRMTARVIVQRFMDNATGRRAINTRRLRVLGLSDDMAERVNQQMLKHVDQTTGLLGRKVSRINIDKWDDIDAKNAFINGVDRWSKKTVMENDVGNMPAFMTTEMGKTIFQFRSFMLASWSKITLAGVHHRDWETASAFLTSMFFGGLFYVGQTHVNAIGREDREEFLRERLSAEAIAKASFLRSGFSSLIPMAIDTALGGVMEPVFAYRTTDLGSHIFGNPTWDLVMNRAYQGLSGAAGAALKSDYDFSQQDWRNLSGMLPFQNAFVVRNVLAAIGGTLPRYSQ